jgi:cell division protein FtsB
MTNEAVEALTRALEALNDEVMQLRLQNKMLRDELLQESARRFELRERLGGG